MPKDQQSTKPTRAKKEDIWKDEGDEGEENPNATFLAAMEVARRQGSQNTTSTTSAPTTPTHEPMKPREEEVELEEPEESRTHLVRHRAPRAEVEEEKFENVYQRETYYIDRAYYPVLKKLIKSKKKTKTDLMNEALDLLFEKYGVTVAKPNK